MKEIFDYLEQLGVSEIEAKLYLKLLETGHISVRQLAKILGINRTSAYLHIDQLIEKGLVMKLVKGSKKLVAANAPEDSLKDLLDKKTQSVQTIQTEFPEIIKEIKSSVPQIKPIREAEITYYKGIYNVKKIYEEAFNGNEIRSYVKVEEVPQLSSNNPGYFHEAFQKNKKLKMWEIIYESPASRKAVIKLLSQNNKGYFCKFMPSNLKWSITSEDILIYDGKVAIINYTGKVSSIILQSPDFYNNSKELFDFIWRIIPDVDQ